MLSTTIEQLPAEREISSRHLPLGPGAVLGCLGSSVASATLHRLMVRARLVGPVAAVEVIQGFQNQQAEAVDSYYLFPLAAGASVSRFRVQIGQRVCEWQVVPKEQTANLTRTPLPGFLSNLFHGEFQAVFCVPLGMIGPGEQVNVDLAYAELLPSVAGDCRFSFPLTMSGRFQTGAGIDDPETESPVSLAPGVVSGPNLALSVALEVAGSPPLKLASSHGLVTHQLAGGELGFELARQDLPARDFTLSYRLGQEKNPQGILRQGRQHFLYHLHPPVVGPPSTNPRHLVVLMDISENAQGRRIEAAKRIAGQLLQSIGPGEVFSLVGFNHNLTGYEQGHACDKSHVGAALNWLQSLKASGRVEINVLLERILQLKPDPSNTVAVVLLACGKLGNEPELYATLTAAPTSTRFYCVGIDQSVNHSFLRRVAGYTRGGCIFIGTEPLDEVTQQKIVADTRGPLLNDLQLVDHGLGINAETFSPAAIPGLPMGDVVSVFGLKAANGGLEARARTFSGHPWIEAVAPLPTQNPAIGLVWAHHKAREMSDELKLISGPRASRLRDVSASLARDYRLVGESTAAVLTDAGAPGGAVLLPSLLTGEWKPEVVIDTTKNTGRFDRGRLQLPPPPPIEDLPPRPAGEPVSEPPTPRAAPVEAAEESVAPSGLTAKAAILSGKPKHEVKRKLTGGMKSEAQTKPMMGSGKISLGKPMLGGKPVLRQEARAAAVPTEETVVENQPKRLPQPNRKPDQAEVAPVETPAVPEPVAVVPEPVPPPVTPPPPPPPAQAVAPPPAAPPSGEGEANPEQLARQLLGGNAEFRQAMMADLKQIYQTLARCAQAGGAIDPQLMPQLEKVLRALQPLTAQSSLLKEAYRIGVLCYQAVRGGDPQALAKTQHWVQRFAKLF